MEYSKMTGGKKSEPNKVRNIPKIGKTFTLHTDYVPKIPDEVFKKTPGKKKKIENDASHTRNECRQRNFWYLGGDLASFSFTFAFFEKKNP